MWAISPTGAAGTSTVTPWPRDLDRVRDAAPWAFVLAAATAYVLALCAALAITPRGVASFLVDPAPGVAALWLSTYAGGTRRRPDRTAWTAVAIILLAGPCLLIATGQPAGTAWQHGPVALILAGTTVLTWRRLLRPRRGGAVAGVWRLLVTGFVAVLPALGLTAVIAQPDLPPVVWLAWAAKATAGIVGPVLLGPALLERSTRALSTTRVVRIVPLLAATAVVGVVEVLADQRLYLLIPLLVWAASTLTVRGTASYVVAALVLALRSAPEGTGPFAVGGLADQTLTANTVVLVFVGVSLTLVRAREERAAGAGDGADPRGRRGGAAAQHRHRGHPGRGRHPRRPPQRRPG